MACQNRLFKLLCLFILVLDASCSKLNVPRILLPVFNNVQTKYLLVADDGGCYKWTTTRSDVIQLNPLDENPDFHCSGRVEVIVATKERIRNNAVVLGEEVKTEIILKCDVITDVITSLSLTTTTREIFMEEVPEVFQLNAYDDFGNEFSSLEGIEFDWHITPLGRKKETVVLRYLPFKDSPYNSPEHIQLLEDDNKKGSIVLLEGVKTGSAKVSVRLPHSEYQDVAPVEVALAVIANLLLLPAEVYMMVGDTVQFRLFYMRNGKLDELTLPDPQYFLTCEDSHMISVDKSSNEVSARHLGKTQVLVQSSNQLDDDPALKLPSTLVNVVKPSYIVLSILPHKNWAILVGDQHEVVAEVYSKDDNRLYLGSNIQIFAQVGNGFHVEERSQNGSWLSGWGLRESRTSVSAKLEAVIHSKLGKYDLDPPVISQAEFYIYPRITISPPEVVLPWDTQIKPKYDIALEAKGGDGRFLWSSTDNTIGVVSQTGHVRTAASGHFTISAAMARNHHNRQHCKFSILPPVRLEIVEFIMEAETFEGIYIHLAMYASKSNNNSDVETYIPFTRCQDLPFQIKQTDNKFVYNKSASIEPVGISCGNIALIGTAVGTSKVTVTYYQDGAPLEDSVTISAYHTLKLISPSPGHPVVMAVGSSIHLVFSGGPKPQVGRQSDHQRIVVVSNEALIYAEDVTDGNSMPLEGITAVWVLCKQLGETDLKLTISNTPTVPNCKSHGSTVTVKVICGKPRRLRIQPEVKVHDAKSCPMDMSADRIIVPNNQDIDLDVVVIDDLGRVFLNTSSLLFSWESKPAGKVDFRSFDSTLTKYEMFGSIPLANKSQQIIRPYMDSGVVEIIATIKGYKNSVLKQFTVVPEWPPFLSADEIDGSPIQPGATINLFLVSNMVVTPNATMIFNQPDIKKELAVLHGSGYVELSLSSDDVAAVNYVEGSRIVEIVPLTSGDMIIQLMDLCLVANPTFVHVKVVTLGKIEVETAGKVEINHCIEVVTKLYDEGDELLNLQDMGMLDMKHRFNKNIANMGRMPQNPEEPWPLGELHYVLSGVELGSTQLTFSLDNRDTIIESEPIDIEVFQPLKINPRNGTLLIGSSLQLTMRGGPGPDAVIEYTKYINQTIKINTVGIVMGIALGSTRVTVRSIGVHPRTAEKIIFAEDTIDINVIKMTGIKICAPLTKFRIGALVPVWVIGIPESISPLILSSFDDTSLSYEWFFGDYDITTFIPAFSSVGVTYRPSDKTVTRITGLQAGKTKLMVNATYSAFGVYPIIYQASIDLEVVETLNLLKPRYQHGRPLMMSRFSSLQLITNLDGICQLEYIIPETRLSGTEVSTGNATPVATITVTDTGYLSAFGTIGFSQLLIIATDESGLKQTLSYIVQVKPIQYMLLAVEANWRIHMDSSLQVIPLGTEFHLRPFFYDNVGNKFNSGPRQVKIRANRLDLVKIVQFTNNATFVVITKKGGHTAIKAWTEGVDNTADYIKVHSREVSKPIVDYLTSGDIMCLWSPVVTRSLQVGFWVSSDPSIIAIDSTIDLAFVLGNVEGTVTLTHSLQANVPLRMLVLPVSEVALIPEKTVFLTNGEETVRRIGVVLNSRKSPADKRSNLIQGWLCDRSFHRYIVPTPFRCFLQFTNKSIALDASLLFHLKSSFSSEIGQYNCKIMTTGFNASEASLIQSNISFWVISDEGELESKPLEIPYIPTPSVPAEIFVGDSSNTAELVVMGLPHILKQVEVLPADAAVLYVDRGYLADSNHKIFTVQIVDYHPKFADQIDTMGLLVRSPLTDQIKRVMVKVSSTYRDDSCSGRSPLVRFVQQYKHALTIVISMMVIFCVTCYVYSRYMQPIVNVNVHPNRSLLAAGFQQSASYPSTSTPMGRTCNCKLGLSPTSPIGTNGCANATSCTCGKPREPVYGDVSTFNAGSPELRRNRRFL